MKGKGNNIKNMKIENKLTKGKGNNSKNMKIERKRKVKGKK
jgi:hypothetical protein